MTRRKPAFGQWVGVWWTMTREERAIRLGRQKPTISDPGACSDSRLRRPAKQF